MIVIGLAAVLGLLIVLVSPRKHRALTATAESPGGSGKLRLAVALARASIAQQCLSQTEDVGAQHEVDRTADAVSTGHDRVEVSGRIALSVHPPRGERRRWTRLWTRDKLATMDMVPWSVNSGSSGEKTMAEKAKARARALRQQAKR